MTTKTKTLPVRMSEEEHIDIAALAHLTKTSMSQAMIDAAREKLAGMYQKLQEKKQ